MKSVQVLPVVVLAAALAAPVRADYVEEEVKDGGAIVGQVKLDGPAPAPEKKAIPDAQHKDCGAKEAPVEALIVSAAGGVQNAVVSIEGITKGKKKPTGPIVMDQKGCVFKPHVLPVMAGTPIAFQNNDASMHNVKVNTFKSKEINEAVIGGGPPLLWTPEYPEKVLIECSVHNWMNCYLAVFDNPYFAVTDAGGKFKIDGVPPGTYKVKVWHEKLGLLKSDKDGAKVFEVKVEAGKDAAAALPAYTTAK